MSHSTVGVILPKECTGSENAEQEVERLLAPFNEGIEVAPYQRPCHCIGHDAFEAACAAANKAVGENPHQTVPEDQWNVWKQKWTTFRDEVLAADPRKAEPRAECKSCEGKGTYESTYNPKSKWDWYSIGGRWAGDLTGAELPDYPDWDNPRYHELREQRNRIAVNMAPIAKLLNQDKPYEFFALLTPDGEWFERGSMGWWGIVADEKQDSDWTTITRSVYEKYRDHVVVLVDVHI